MPDDSDLQVIGMRFHPFADLFPPMAEQEYAGLAADIRQNGLQTPIVKMAGTILDGRHRFRACREVGVEPQFVDYNGADPTAFVISANLHRRHLNVSQRGMIAGKLANMPQGARTDLGPSAILQKVSQPTAAKLLNVSPRSVADAKKILDRGTPELARRVERGEISVSVAAQIADMSLDQQTSLSGLDPHALRAAVKAAHDQREATSVESKQVISDRLVWNDQQANLLRQIAANRGGHAQVDWLKIAETLEAPNKTLRNELANRVSTALKYLIQLGLTVPRHRKACRDAIERELQAIELLSADAPSLRLTIPTLISAELAGAREAALKALRAQKPSFFVIEGAVLRPVPKTKSEDPYEIEMCIGWATHGLELWASKLSMGKQALPRVSPKG